VNMCNEVWTGSEYNAKAIRSAGVTIPIFLIPEAIDTSITPDQIKPFLTANKDDFRFYSIFEWTERKNPGVLLEAYWLEFENTQNVSLTIKTYLDDFTAAKKNEIDNYIRKIKVRLGLKNYAPIYLYQQLLSRSQMYRFHRSFNCFVSPHRGEGWGIPQMEALLMGNAIISTNCGGVHEYFKNTIDAILLEHTLTQVSNNRNGQWYQPDQQWASVEVDTVRKALRWVFDHQAAAGETAKRGGSTVRQLFSFKTVGDQMAKRLRQIEETFNAA